VDGQPSINENNKKECVIAQICCTKKKKWSLHWKKNKKMSHDLQ
jgi:hypothetical protein